MIPISPLGPANEPTHFDGNCRQPGAAWLAQYPNDDPHSKSQWWSQFQPALAAHFSHRCGWLAMDIGLMGHVDHYLACGNRKGKPSPHRHRAFDWSNYRYIEGRINSLKGNLDDRILDPCEVQPGWFEVVLPNFVLKATAAIPPNHRAKADFTLKKLQLFNGHNARWTRWSWYQKHWNNGSPDLKALYRDAPLVAEAVDRALQQGSCLPNPTLAKPVVAIIPRKRLYSRRLKKPSIPSTS